MTRRESWVMMTRNESYQPCQRHITHLTSGMYVLNEGENDSSLWLFMSVNGNDIHTWVSVYVAFIMSLNDYNTAYVCSFCVTWLWRDSCICVTQLVRVCDMTHSNVITLTRVRWAFIGRYAYTYIRIYIYIYIYIYIRRMRWAFIGRYFYIYTYIYIHIYMHIYIHCMRWAFIGRYLYKNTYTYTYTQICTYIHTLYAIGFIGRYLYICTYTYIHTYMYIHIYIRRTRWAFISMYLYICTYAYIHMYI